MAINRSALQDEENDDTDIEWTEFLSENDDSDEEAEFTANESHVLSQSWVMVPSSIQPEQATVIENVDQTSPATNAGPLKIDSPNQPEKKPEPLFVEPKSDDRLLTSPISQPILNQNLEKKEEITTAIQNSDPQADVKSHIQTDLNNSASLQAAPRDESGCQLEASRHDTSGGQGTRGVQEIKSIPEPTNLSLSEITYTQEYKSPTVKGTRTSLNILTFNAPFFPTTVLSCIHIHQINGDVLPANAVRLPVLKQKITELNPDIFGLQEIWAKDVALDLIQYFGEQGYNYLNLRMGLTIQVGGVMLFSKLPLIDSKKIYWSNNSFPVEWYGGKGAIAAHYKLEKEKFNLEEDKIITVGVFHQPGGDSSNCEAKFTGTSSFRRGQNIDKIHTELLTSEWWQKPTTNEPTPPYHAGVIMGDHNFSLECPEVEVQTPDGPKKMRDTRKLVSVSIEGSNNGFKENELKYGWLDHSGNKRGLLGYESDIVATQPTNFEDIREARPVTKGAGKQRITAKVEDAITNGNSTGTDRLELKDVTLSDGTIVKGNSPQEPIRLIDGMYQTKDSANRCNLKTKIIHVDGADPEGKPIAISDHELLAGELDLTTPSQELPSIYEGSMPEPTNRRNPGEGCWQRVKRIFCCETSSPTLFTLKPNIGKAKELVLEEKKPTLACVRN